MTHVIYQLPSSDKLSALSPHLASGPLVTSSSLLINTWSNFYQLVLVGQDGKQCPHSPPGHDDARDRSVQHHSQQVSGLSSIRVTKEHGLIALSRTGYAMCAELRFPRSQPAEAVRAASHSNVCFTSC